jgi:intein/homing endonuclease
MAQQFTNHDKEMLEIMRDPAKWAAHHLGEAPRWYQEQILRHPHHRKVLRCGRRIGKCIEETQRVLDPKTGAYTSVSDLFAQQKSGVKPSLITLNEKYQLDPSEAFFVEDNGVKETFLVRTKYGAEVILTGNHPVLTLDGWVEVDALQKGMRIATPSALPYFGKGLTLYEKVKVIAYLIAGGHWNGSQLTFSVKSTAVMKDFMEAAVKLNIKFVKQVNKENTCVITSKLDQDIMDAVMKKKIPSFIFELKKEQISLFLSCLYAVNGWVYNGSRPEIGFATSSKQLAMDMKHLLLRFGIQTNLQTKKQKYKDSFNYIYQLMIHRREALMLFAMDMNVIGQEKALLSVSDKAEMTEVVEQTVPIEVWKYIDEERKEKKMSKAQVSGSTDERLRTTVAPTMSKIRKYADNLQSAFLYDLARADVIWEEVTAIESLGKRQTYDVFVPETHNLVVEDVLVHNTWTMTAHMLWVAFTCNGGTELKKGATCLVATPYDTQAREIFDQLNNFINNNPVLQAAVASIRRSPYEIVFKNKSRIKLYTAGTRSGTEGGSLRGQKASWLYMDEVDYLGDKDFEAIFAITLERPDEIGVMVASTPTGRRGKFYQICMQEKLNQDVRLFKGGPDVEGKLANQFDIRTYDRLTAEGWAEFYFPTMVNPGWSPKMERELRNLYTDVGYQHEVMAEFGTELVGVFNKDYIDEASSNGYSLLSHPRVDSPISIGIDWDKFGNATQIVVTQWNPFLERRPRPEIDGPGVTRYGRFQVINRIEIPKGEFTYDQAVRKVIELDAIYKPFAIYPDRGAGEYQIEMLRKTLGDKVQGVHLGGSYMVRDPHSREFDKKPIKPFIVNQTTLILERGQLMVPHKDIDEVIVRQMTNYTVERVSPKTGEPTYSSVDEHALDAMMLSIFAFIDRMPDIVKTIEDVKPATTLAVADVKFVDPIGRIYKGHAQTHEQVQEYLTRWDEPTPPPPRKVEAGKRTSGFGWGARGSGGGRTGLPSRSRW